MGYWIRVTAWAAMAGCALGVGAQVWALVTGDPEVFDSKYGAGLPVVLAHGGFGAAALCLGPFQFMAAGWPRIHRLLGSVYLFSVLVSAGAALAISPIADGGLWGRAGAAVEAALWLGTGILGWVRARAGLEHRGWVMRNYALTLGAVTMPVMADAFGAAGIPAGQALPWLAWLSWMPNLVAAELLIRWVPPTGGRLPAHA